jgi:hypothetical protein
VTTSRLSRHALIVATSNYSDPRLAQLRSPAADSEALAEVLGDPSKGDFEVQLGLNESHAELMRRIALFFRDRIPNDLLLLHLSCHGVKDENGELYLAAADTDLDLLSATAIPATWLNERIDRTRSRRTVLLLDCCFSGSFPAGVRHRGGSDMDAPRQLQGRGRAIITASNAMEYAYEGDELTGEGHPSFFTGAVVEGLRTGMADLDMDHLVSIDDLYHYVYDRVRERTPHQTPSIKSDVEGVLYLARSSYRALVAPAQLDPELVARTEDRYAGVREGAVQELAELLTASDASVALAARELLMMMAADDSRRVSARAQIALEAAEVAPQAPPPEAPALPKKSAPRPPQVSSPPRSRRPVAIVAAVAALVALVVVVVVSLNGSSGVSSTSSTGAATAVNTSDKIPAGNLTVNPSFERDLSHWDTFQSNLSREQASDAPDGRHVVRVSAISPSGDWAIDDTPDTVTDSVAGAHYTAAAWVKSTDSSVGTVACLTVRERTADGGLIGQASAGRPMSLDGYMQVRVPYAARRSADRIDIHLTARHPSGAVNDSFLADALTLSKGDAGVIGSDC